MPGLVDPKHIQEILRGVSSLKEAVKALNPKVSPKSTPSEKTFAYVIGYPTHYGVSTYTFHNGDVINGTLETAKVSLEVVLQDSPKKKWRIYKLEELCKD